MKETVEKNVERKIAEILELNLEMPSDNAKAISKKTVKDALTMNLNRRQRVVLAFKRFNKKYDGVWQTIGFGAFALVVVFSLFMLCSNIGGYPHKYEAIPENTRFYDEAYPGDNNHLCIGRTGRASGNVPL